MTLGRYPPRRVIYLPSFCRKLTGKCWYACHKNCIYSYYSLEKCTEKGRGGCEEEKITWTVKEEPAAGGDACYGNASWNEYYIGLCR